MATINILTKETIDKIAAGEVVERPASVIKELMENAIDAHATAVSVEIKGGGIEFIRVTDNGLGIEKSEIKKAFMRHTTSKIMDASDLITVSSLGFRGEALSSISAVSKVELITKTADDLLGNRYIIEGSVEREFSEIGAPNGTTFIIRELFYNTPARRKFLKTDSTEGSKCFDVVEHLALSHPEIAFKFIADGREKLSTPGNNNLYDAIYKIYGREIASNLLDLEYEDENLSISGFIGKSTLARGNRNFESFFIDGRFIRSNALSRACEDGYYGFMMGHQFPFFIINLSVKSGEVDVNVHPTKQEVRFYNEEAIKRALTSAINERLRRREDIEDISLEEVKMPEVASVTYEPAKSEKQVNTTVSDNDSANISVSDVLPVKKTEPLKAPEPFERSRLEAIKQQVAAQISHDSPYEKRFEEKVRYEQTTFISPEAVKEHKIIGQVFSTYWIVEYDGQMYIIDQHAAHEKVLFEKTMKLLKEQKAQTQMLSPSIIVSLTPTDLANLEEYKDAFEEIGYVISSFGGKEVSIDGIPLGLPSIDKKDLFLEILSDCGSYKASESHDAIVERVATMSCKAAVKGHDKLSVMEAQALIDELLSLDNPYHCPHGRPTMIKFSQYELEKKFKRII